MTERLFFAADNGVTGFEFYVTDGVTVEALGDLNPGAANGYPGTREVAALPGRIVFAAETAAGGIEPYVTDGTSAGTLRLADIFPGAADSDPEEFVSFGGGALFQAESPAEGTELWFSDGTPGGTRLVRNIGPGDDDGDPEHIAVLGQLAVFEVEAGGPVEVWVSDGTGGGTRALLTRDNAQVSRPSLVSEPGDNILGGRVFFRAETPDAGRELWVSDGTEAGTRLVRNIFPDMPGQAPNDSIPSEFQAFAGRMYFAANDGVAGEELWVTDGTAAGTRLVADILPGPEGSRPDQLTVAGDTLFFTAEAGTGRELWATEGTPESTRLVADLNPGAVSSVPIALAALGDRIVFSAETPGVGLIPYVSDGTSEGTRPLIDPTNGILPRTANDFTVVGDLAFFEAVDAARSGFDKLWMTDGTVAGTRLAPDVNPGGDANPFLLGVLDTGAGGQVPAPTDAPDSVAFASLADLADAVEMSGGSFDGRGGTDLLTVGAARADFDDVLNADGSVTLAFGSEAATVEGFEYIRFDDGSYVFDLRENGGTQEDLEFTYRLYKSSVARDPDIGGLRFWYGELTAGRQDRDSLAEQFVGSTEFNLQFPQTDGDGVPIDDVTFVRSYYRNVLGREADEAGLNFWVDSFQAGVSRAQLLRAFAESPEFVGLNEDNYDDGVFVLRVLDSEFDQGLL